MKQLNPVNPGLRKAAVLVSSLDQAAADAVLDCLTPEQANEVRRIVVDLGDVDRREQRRVLDEFSRVGPLLPGKSPPGIELDDRFARRPAMRPQRESDDEPATAAAPGGAGFASVSGRGEPFRFLRDAEVDKLVRVLAGERPQTIALVLSHLPPQQAGSVLARLQPALQNVVVHRLVDLEETNPEILREVEQALQSRLSEQVQMQRRRVAGLAAVTGILQASEGRTGMQILDNLARHDRALAERLGPRPLAFADLADADAGVLSAVVRSIDANVLATALIGAAADVQERFCGLLPQSEAEKMRKQIESPGPIRLRDVEEARRRLAAAAQREMRGSSQRPFPVAHESLTQ